VRLPAFITICLMLVFGSAWANEPVTTAYINLQPAVIGNYSASGGKLKFYKADIALRVKSNNVARVEYHAPLIRDQLVMQFAQQTDEDFASVEAKEGVRRAALLRVQSVLEREEGETLVEDLLFNNLVVQK